MHSGITHGWWFFDEPKWWVHCVLWAAVVVLFTKRRNGGFTPIRKFLVVRKVFFTVSPPDSTLLGTATSLSVCAFCSGTTPGPDEVSGLRAASGSLVLRTVGCSQGGGEQDVLSVHLSLILLRYSQNPSRLLLFGIWCSCVCTITVGCSHPGEETPREVHTENQRMNTGVLEGRLRAR